MKIYNRLVIDIASGKVIEENSYIYSGPICLLKGGSGGGGSSGRVDYPTYMKMLHQEALMGDSPYDWTNMLGVAHHIELLETASPYSDLAAFDPSETLDDIFSKIKHLEGVIYQFCHKEEFKEILSTANEAFEDDPDFSYDAVDDVVTTLDASQRMVRARSETLFDAQLADIGAVMTSAFAVAKANLLADSVRAMQAQEKDIRLRHMAARMQSKTQATDSMVKVLMLNIEALGDYIKTFADVSMKKIVAYKEQYDRDAELDQLDADFPLSLYERFGNLLASIGGASVKSWQAENPKASSSRLSGAIGGGLGVAALAMMIPGIGTLGAAALGVGGALLGGMG